MVQIHPSCAGLAQAATAVLVLLLFVVSGAAQESGGDGSSVTLNLKGEAHDLTDHASVQDWVSKSLHAKLGLSSGNRLDVSPNPKKLANSTVYTISQHAHGLPIVTMESRLILDPDGNPIVLLGHHKELPVPPDTTPSLSVNDILERWGMSEEDVASKRLVCWPDGTRLILSYELEGVFQDGPSGFERIYVDAHAGNIIERFPLDLHGLERRIYDFSKACRASRVRSLVPDRRSVRMMTTALRRHLVRNETSRSSGDRSTDQLFEVFGGFHRFLEEILGMDSFDDAGSPINGLVNVRFHPKRMTPQCVGEEFNAFWSSSLKLAAFTTRALEYSEMVGHELGHGLVTSGSRLIYQGESGALHESIADSIGVTFRAWIETNGNPAGKLPVDIWDVRGPTGPIRDFRNPRRVRGLPNHYSDYRFLRADIDHGGVHVNSSIINQGFYLLAVGGHHPDIHTGPTVTGIGIAKAIEIFGRAGFNILTPNSSFADARQAFAYVAEILHGEESPEWVATHTAMDAIGVPGYWQRPTSPLPDPVAQDIQAPEESADPEPERTNQPEREAEPPATSDPLDDSEQPVASPSGPTPVTKTTPAPKTTDPSPTRHDTRPTTPRKNPNSPRMPTVPSRLSPETETQPTRDQPSTPVNIPTLGAALIVLLGTILALLRIRAYGRAADRGTATSMTEDLDLQRPDSSKAASGRALGSFPASQAVGSLAALDGSSRISLPMHLLQSSEGVVIGRAPELCHVSVADLSVSRRHLRCRIKDGRIWIEDLNSTKGTEVNGERLTPFRPTRVAGSQLVRIGNNSYVLSTNETPKPRPSSRHNFKP